jgi:RNA polymerase sigma-70 factor (ECF subfamily)
VRPASEEFERRADPFRRELLAHCYRMLGSPHEAEDLVQETMLRAWRAYDRFDVTRASFRTWLYRIATNACLTALSGSSRRPLPSGLGPPGDDPEVPLVPAFDIPWLEPMPDMMLGASGDPETTLGVREGLRLAFVAAIQFLPARQRAVLILRDALAFSALEVADILDSTPAAVNSSLQRARARLAELDATEDCIQEPTDPTSRALVDEYIEAFESANVEALTRLLADQVVLEMAPGCTVAGRTGALRLVHRPRLPAPRSGLAHVFHRRQRPTGARRIRPRPRGHLRRPQPPGPQPDRRPDQPQRGVPEPRSVHAVGLPLTR